MQLPRPLRVVLLTILCFFLNLPIGIDVPSRTEVLSTSLDRGPVVCEKTAEGYTASFTVQCRQARRSVIANEGSPYLKLKVFIMDEALARYPDDVLNYQFDELDPDDYDPKDYYRENVLYYDVFPEVKSDFTYEIPGDPILIREGDDFSYNVRVTLPGSSPAGVYSLTFQTEYRFYEIVYKDILIVR